MNSFFLIERKGNVFLPIRYGLVENGLGNFVDNGLAQFFLYLIQGLRVREILEGGEFPLEVFLRVRLVSETHVDGDAQSRFFRDAVFAYRHRCYGVVGDFAFDHQVAVVRDLTQSCLARVEVAQCFVKHRRELRVNQGRLVRKRPNRNRTRLGIVNRRSVEFIGNGAGARDNKDGYGDENAVNMSCHVIQGCIL